MKPIQTWKCIVKRHHCDIVRTDREVGKHVAIVPVADDTDIVDAEYLTKAATHHDALVDALDELVAEFDAEQEEIAKEPSHIGRPDTGGIAYAHIVLTFINAKPGHATEVR